MNKKPILALAALVALSSPALAHRFWIVPSSTVLSGEQPWVTFDAAVSNNLFFPDHVAPAVEAFQATGPDGKEVTLQNGAKGKYRTVFDIALEKEGTYRVGTVREMILATWKEDGETKNFRGSAADFKAAALDGKPELSVTESYSRVETYVTRGEPNKEALKPTGKGLEVVFDQTHPNDLFAGEKSVFTLHLNGKPAAGVKVSIIKGDDRYRSEAGEIAATTNEKGEFEVTWPEAGRFWVNAAVGGGRGPGAGGPPQAGGQKPAGAPAQGGGGGGGGARSGYTAVFEVLPE
ncbi:DUF4198 domain-containing protein [Luteolibacter flavescens]|uniref:DUF4198 domain-containing protein n=1 Tax=Luteolibacter flavescens TaxID=1859460 RepID=A0ABT3FHV4_9BACT|nr:DUF4198 domain-containing protein [Luteolibacter flavescens]MCW1883140.1 DUF4198 domain-containing protein [Luteolibacter flavescens]